MGGRGTASTKKKNSAKRRGKSCPSCSGTEKGAHKTHKPRRRPKKTTDGKGERFLCFKGTPANEGGEKSEEGNRKPVWLHAKGKKKLVYAKK